MNPKVDDKFKELMNCNDDKNCEVKSNIGKLHKYLGMNFYFTEKVKVKINMDDYVERMINDFQAKISNIDIALNPSKNNIFEKGNI